jgi:mevalonate kinase
MYSAEDLGLVRTKERDENAYTAIAEDCVVEASSPGVFFWSGEHVVLGGGVAVCQQVPLRVWVGLRRRRGTEASPFSIVASEFDKHHRAWPPAGPSGPHTIGPIDRAFEWKRVSPALEELSRWGVSRGLLGTYELRSLHEVRPASGCNWSGAFSSALVACVLQLKGLTRERVAQWADRDRTYVCPATSTEDTTDHPWMLAEFHRLAFRIETVLHGGRASGYGTLCSAIPEQGPLLYVTGDRVSTGIPADLSKELDLVSQISAVATSVLGLVGSSNEVLRELPVGYGLVYTGRPKATAHSILGTEMIAKLFDPIVATIADVLQRPGFEDVLMQNMRLSEIATGQIGGDTIRAEQVRAVAGSSLGVCSALMHLLKEVAAGHDATHTKPQVEELARAMRRNQGGLTQLGLEWREGREVAECIYKWAHQGNFLDRTAVKLTGGGGGGQVLVMLPEHRARYDEIDSVLEPARNYFNTDEIRVEWLSTDGRDGLGGKGLVGLVLPPESDDAPPDGML